MANKKDITSLRRLINESEAFVKKGKALLKRLEAGEEVESPSPTLSKKKRREALINELLTTGRRVKKKDIKGL
ncbi:hypothetical protein [uncultured Winogradskyella sp.]|uniref:hypothetical protein n=1 Tax=uncultured Winogradskyella sp. TaxID=395353 RepID=UPI002629D8BF|nr:hypothetical protein [uncultured Winogradskyella sp.]